MSELSTAIHRAFRRQTNRALSKGQAATVKGFAKLLSAKRVAPDEFFSDAALAYATGTTLAAKPSQRLYTLNRGLKDAARSFVRYDRTKRFRLNSRAVKRAALRTNEALHKLNELGAAFGAPVFRTLGMRNLSSFVGETFKQNLAHALGDRLVFANPHQDGHPDLLALTQRGRAHIQAVCSIKEWTAKRHWARYAYGGIEIKATCADTKQANKGVAKLEIGHYRLDAVVGVTWKAHHDANTSLLAIWWDFIDGSATILAVFYTNRLTATDWRKQEAKTDGRTTNMAAVEPSGLMKLARGWILLPRDRAQREKILAVMTRKRKSRTKLKARRAPSGMSRRSRTL